MTWFSVIIPAVDRGVANATLEAEGFGVENFSVPLWRGDEQDPDSYGLNASMDDPAFRAAIEDLPNRSIWDATSGEVEFDQHVAAEGLKREPTPFVDQGLPAE